MGPPRLRHFLPFLLLCLLAAVSTSARDKNEDNYYDDEGFRDDDLEEDFEEEEEDDDVDTVDDPDFSAERVVEEEGDDDDDDDDEEEELEEEEEDETGQDENRMLRRSSRLIKVKVLSSNLRTPTINVCLRCFRQRRIPTGDGLTVRGRRRVIRRPRRNRRNRRRRLEDVVSQEEEEARRRGLERGNRIKRQRLGQLPQPQLGRWEVKEPPSPGREPDQLVASILCAFFLIFESLPYLQKVRGGHKDKNRGQVCYVV